MVQDNYNKYISYRNDTLQTIKKNKRQKMEFMKQNSLFNNVEENEIILSNLPLNFNIYEFLNNSINENYYMIVKHIQKDILGGISSFKISFESKNIKDSFLMRFNQLTIVY